MTPTQQPHNKVDTLIAPSYLLRFRGTTRWGERKGRGGGRGEWEEEVGGESTGGGVAGGESWDGIQRTGSHTRGSV